jgi:hypothetical protein
MKYVILASLAAIFVFPGCDIETGSSILPTATKQWESRPDGYTQFYTNDPQYYSYGFWNLYDNSTASNTYEIECRKYSGSRDSLYGMVFGASSSSSYQYYYIGIIDDGYYIIWKKDGEGSGTIDIEKLGPLDNLYSDEYNVIKVTRSGINYTLFINDSQVCQFTILATDTFGSRIGYYVSVGSESEEDFPNAPVDVRFKQKK